MNILAALANGETHFADTRYFFAAKDTIAMETAGTELGRFDASAHLGIGTSGPVTDRLKIQGETSDDTAYALRVTNSDDDNLFSVRNDGLVSFGANSDLFPLLALQNLLVIVGRVNASGTKNFGEGFTTSRISEGRYRVTFANPFSSRPVVLVTASIDSGLDDNVANTLNIGLTGFEVVIMDVNPTTEFVEEDAPFDFIAIGQRA